MFKKKQARDAPITIQEILPFVQDVSPLKHILQRFGHSPWTEKVVIDVYTIPELGEKFKNMWRYIINLHIL